MVRNYLKIAYRNLIRDKHFSLINIAGLAVGMAATLLILQYVTFERSYDRFHTKSDRIFRVKTDRFEKGVLATEWAGGPFAVGNHMKDALPEVEDYVKMSMNGRSELEVNDNAIKVDQSSFASKSFFKVFSYPLLSGDAQTALNEPNAVVISESLAKRLFGSGNPLGETIMLNRDLPIKVTGLYRDFPTNTHLQAEFLVSFATLERLMNPENDPEQDLDNAWNRDGCLTYLLVKEGTNPQKLEAEFPAFIAQAQPETVTGTYGLAFHLQSLPDIHLYSHYMMEAGPNGDGKAVCILLAVALFIILIAWVNYVNLATARAIRRAREVGVRKAVGSFRSQLVSQFLLESALLNFVAVAAACIIVATSLPLFNHFTGQSLTHSLFNTSQFWLGLGVMFITGTVLSGAYPAFVLSGFKPTEVLKGGTSGQGQGAVLRKSLVVVQFAASVFLLVGTITVFRQVQFMRNQNLGVDVDQTLVLSRPVNDSTRVSRTKAFKEEILRQSMFKSVTVSNTIPGEKVIGNVGGIRLESAPENTGKQYRFIWTDYDFIPSFGLKVVAGRNFNNALGEKDAVVFNRMGAKQLGFDDPEKALGEKINFDGNIRTIVGVVEDFHQESLREAYEPLILCLEPNVNGTISLKLNTKTVDEAVTAVKKAWAQFFPEEAFEYAFLDEKYDKQYQADERFGQIFGFFALLAVLVSCLGLLGLSSFVTSQRTKEIGIRKVLGASVASVMSLLAKDFLILVTLAIVIASPIAFYLMNQWLDNFAFSTSMPWWIFAAAGLATLAVALITVSFQAIKAALMNPVESLRSE